MQPVLNPAISKYGHVLGAATWKVRIRAHTHARTGYGTANWLGGVTYEVL